MTTLQRHPGAPASHAAPSGFWGWPHSRIGWLTALAGLLFAAPAVMLPAIQSALKDSGGGRLGGGREIVTLAVVLGAAVSACAIVALRRYGERSVLVWLSAVPAFLMTAFWVLFAAGEGLIGHD